MKVSEPVTSTLIPDGEIDSWVRAMFATAQLSEVDGVRVVVKIGGQALPSGFGGTAGGDEVDEGTRAAIRELTQSLAMHSGVTVPGDAVVAAPPRETISRALHALADPIARGKALGAALSIFGRRVVAPLERLLAARNSGPTARLVQWRAALRNGLADLRLAHETTQILRGDLARVFTDEYLHMLGENEEKTLRPRLAELAHRVLDVLASTFHRALDRFGANADRVAIGIVRQLPRSMALRNLPSLVKQGFVAAVGEFLAVETSADLRGALHTLSGQYSDVVPAGQPLGFADEWYRDLAQECWDVIATYC
jgi:hypothetical protein